MEGIQGQIIPLVLDDENDTSVIISVGNLLDLHTEKSDETEETGSEYVFPPHLHCVSHTLKLSASENGGTAMSNVPNKKLYLASMGKCQALWNVTRQS